MRVMEEEIIELSRRKILSVVVGAFVLGCIGAWLIFLDDNTIRGARHDQMPWLVHSVGIITVAFFGACTVCGIRKLLDNNAGFIFSPYGFLDNSISVGGCTVPWIDVVGTEEVVISMQRMLVVKLREPEKYLEYGWGLREIIRKATYKSYSSPIIITSALLNVDFPKFACMFKRYSRTYGSH
ncbi:MAG: hypothetical protein FWD68_00660 [Alphaproteobacteria bacterium]|nr:hypothetical protein [Alphaproteobacteria bacterium]